MQSCVVLLEDGVCQASDGCLSGSRWVQPLDISGENLFQITMDPIKDVHVKYPMTAQSTITMVGLLC